MSTELDDDPLEYHVVLNDEEQYSIWPTDRDLPPGWRAEGTIGRKAACLAHIDEVWTDMRPLSLRRFMAEAASRPPVHVPEPPEEETLVARLSAGQHPVEVSLRPERTAAALQAAIGRGYVFVKFTGTRGGTELGVRLDPTAVDVSGADFDRGTGAVSIAGDLTLDFEPVRAFAEIDLATLSGHGHLALRPQP